jgi:hypothetical protein
MSKHNRDRRRDKRRAKKRSGHPLSGRMVAERVELTPEQEAALDEIAEPCKPVLMNGLPVCVLRPKSSYQLPAEDDMDFDRRICAAGVKDYVRPRFPEDWRANGKPLDVEEAWVLVEELRPGMRTRRPATVFFNRP